MKFPPWLPPPHGKMLLATTWKNPLLTPLEKILPASIPVSEAEEVEIGGALPVIVSTRLVRPRSNVTEIHG